MQGILRLLYPTVLLIVFSIFYGAGLGDPVIIDYDEGIYAEVAREMYRAGQPLLPTYNGTDFFEKPPLLYWLQMSGYHLFGVNAWGARVFNAACGLLTILVLYFGARGPLGDRIAFQASLVLGSTLIFTYLSRVAMTDMPLTLLLTLCLVVSWHGVERALRQQGGTALFWLGCLFAGLAMLAKGIIGALFPLLTALIYLLSIRRPGILLQKHWLLPGAAIIALVGFSWYLVLGFVHPGGFSFMQELFVKHHLGRFSAPMEGHSGPFYFYVIVLAIGFLPWCAYLPHAVLSAPLTDRRQPAHRFLRLFAIFSALVLVFFSIAATKLPNYILPALPGLSLLLAVLFDDKAAAGSRSWRAAAWSAALLMAAIGLLIAALPLLFPYLNELLGKDARKAPILAEPVGLGLSPWLIAASFLLAGYLLVKIRGITQRRRIFETLVLTALITGTAFFHLGIPLYDRLMNAPLARIARQAAELTPPDGTVVVFVVDGRPSINFVAERFTVRRAERDFAEIPELFLRPGHVVGITTSYYLQRLQTAGIGTEELARDGGYVLFRIIGAQQPETESAEFNQLIY